MSKILLGSDPELFFVRKGKFISAVGMCKGTKEKPFVFDKGFKIHNDNVACEFNVPAAADADEWVANHHHALKYVRDVAKENGCTLKIVSDAVFDDDQLQTDEAKEFGCNPDFSAWELADNPSPKAENSNLRTAGGHIHIGAKLTFREKIQLVRLLDIFLGVPLAMLEPGSRRNELYGGPGCMRDKPYGVEYRTPSNFWLRNTQMMRDVYNLVYNVVANREMLVGLLDEINNDLSILQDKHTDVLRNGVYNYSGGLYLGSIHGHVL